MQSKNTIMLLTLLLVAYAFVAATTGPLLTTKATLKSMATCTTGQQPQCRLVMVHVLP